MERSEKLTLLEILCVFFWFLFDGFWLMEWELLTYTGSLISFSLAMAIFFYLEREAVAVLIASVDTCDTCWLLMNIFWIVFDFTKIEWAIEAAKISFGVGIIIFIFAFVIGAPTRTIFRLVLRRFRAFRLFFAEK